MSSNYIDLTHTIWTPQEFKQNSLRVEDQSKGTLNILFEKMPPKKAASIISLPWTTGIYEGVKFWGVGSKDPTSLFSVSEALNQMANRLLNQEFEDASKELKSADPAHVKLQKIQERSQHLQNLKLNLENHNVIVKKFNERFFFKDKLVGCPTHNKVLKQVNQKLAKLRKMDKQLNNELNEKIKETNGFFDQLEINLENGLRLDKEIILMTYPSVLEKLKDLDNKNQAIFTKRIDTLLNKYYLSNLMNNPLPTPLPMSLNILKGKLGISDDQLQSKILAGQQELLEKLRSYQKEDKLLLNSPEFVDQIQMDFLKIAVKNLAASPEQAELLQPFIEKLYLLETKNQRLILQEQTKIRTEFSQILLDAKAETEEMEREKVILRDLWNRYEIPSLLPELFEKYFGHLNPSHFDTPEKLVENLPLLEKAYQQMKKEVTSKKIFTLYFNKVSQKMEELAQEAKQRAHIPTWFEKNAHAQRFSFNQGSWGKQQIFGGGACKAVNYRWIRHLLEKPSRTVKSADDLNLALKRQKALKAWEESPLFKKMVPTYVEEREMSGIMAEDRIKQATYGLGIALGVREAPGSIGAAILKRDKLNHAILVTNKPTIESLIDSLVKEHFNALVSPLTGGIIEIGIIQNNLGNLSNGHAMGMQIDPHSDMYRFWDVNSGFYQYSTLEEMKTAFKEYMKEIYKGEYNIFRAGQYSKQVA